MKFQCSYVFPVISSKTWDKMLVMKRFKLHANSILGVDSWQRIDSAFLESGFVSVFFMHVYMYTCIRFTIEFIFDVENNVQHQTLVPYISDKSHSSSEVFRNQNCNSTQVSCSRNLVRCHRKKKRVSFLKFWTWWTKRNRTLNIYHGRRCVYGYIQYAFFFEGW